MDLDSGGSSGHNLRVATYPPEVLLYQAEVDIIDHTVCRVLRDWVV